jgi:5-methylcytosine-specific restriction endonuclease McrA
LAAPDDSTLGAVFAKTSGSCTYCASPIWRGHHDGSGDGAWHVDHWRPRSRCRTSAECDAIDNLWPICTMCRASKAETTGSEYLWHRWASDEPVSARWRAWLRDIEQ